MSNCPSCISAGAADQSLSDSCCDVIAKIAKGPKWICHISSEVSQEFSKLTNEQVLALESLVLQLKPVNIKLATCSVGNNGILAASEVDHPGLVRAYAFINSGREIEIVGVIPTGFWRYGNMAWWLGSYEIPLLRQMESLIIPLMNVLQISHKAHLHMSLLELQGYDLIARSGADNERSYKFPRKVNDFNFPSVCIDNFTAQTEKLLISAFDQIRVCAKVDPPAQFYL